MGLFSKIKETLTAGKDVSASLVARKMIEKRFSQYGSVRRLSLDSTTKQLQLEVLLAGETEPLTVTVQRYEIQKTVDGATLTVRAVTASREWINQALADLLVDRTFRIPAKYESVVALFM